MAGNDSNELVVAANGSIHVGPVGTSVPEDPTDALTGFTELGYVTEDGVTFGRGVTVQDFRAWQKRLPVRHSVTEEEMTASFALEQWNEDNFDFAFGGGEVTEPEPGIFRYDFPSGDDALDERALVIRWADGDKHYQLAFERGNVTDEVEVQLARTDLSVLPIGYKALSGDDDTIGVFFTTDDPAFGAS